MVTEPLVFRDLAYVFAAAVLGGGLAWLARQPLILGYVLGGILVSPLTPGPSVSDLHTFELFAEIGVVLLMFSIGLEFSLRDLLQVRRVALLGAPIGILLSIGLGLAAGWALGWPPEPGAGRRHPDLRREHDGPGPAPDRSGRAPHAPRPRDDRDHPRRGPRRRDPDRADARAGRARDGGPRRGRTRPAPGRRHPRPVLAARVPRDAARAHLGGAHAEPRAVPPRRAGDRDRDRRAHPGGRVCRWRSARSSPACS